MNTATTSKLLNSISEEQSLKTWSLIMTFFGDAVVPRGGCIASSSLQAVMAALHIDNGAVRTALSRLTNDGQLVREKSGRNSFYSLAPSQVQAFDIAQRRIYTPATVNKKPVNAKLIAYTPGTNTGNDMVADALPIGNGLAIQFDAEGPNTDQEKRIVIDGVCSTLPATLIENALPNGLMKKYAAFTTNFNALNESINQTNDLNATACRCLLIHEWRRLVLKTPVIPYQLLSKDSNIKAAHDTVASGYKQLLVPSERWLDNEAVDRDGKLGPPQPQYINRFTDLA